MTITTRAGIVTVFLAALTPLLAQSPKSAAVLVQEASRLATIQGDHRGAAAKYEEAVEAAGADRGLAARALFGAATAYEQVGDAAKAQSFYERVVTAFADQTQVVTAARQRLAAMGPVAVAAAAPATQQSSLPAAERIWAADGAVDGSLSANGRWLAFSDWSDGQGELVVRDLRTGEQRQLATGGSSRGWVGDVLISPDGESVAFRWEGGLDESTRTIRRDGTGERILTRQPYGEFLHRWSPDGQVIAAVRHNYATDQITQIVLIDVAEGRSAQLKSMDNWREPSIGGFSPDGRTLLVSGADRPGITLLSRDGSGERVIAADIPVPGAAFWSPDGREVIFLDGRGQQPRLVAVRADAAEGVGAGEPRVIVASVPAQAGLKGIAPDGSFYYGLTNARRSPFLADFDPTSLAVQRTARIGSPSQNGGFPELSADGRRVALMRQGMVAVRENATGEERIFRQVTGVYGIQRFVWLRDGRSLLVRTQQGVVRLDTESGEVHGVVPEDAITWNLVALSPDGADLYYSKVDVIDGRAGPADLKQVRLLKRSIETGAGVELYTTESRSLGYFGLTVSNDGKWLAYTIGVGENQQALMLLSTAGGAPQEIGRWRLGTVNVQGAMSWTPDDRHLLLAAQCGPGQTMALCAIFREGGDLRLVMANLQDLWGPALSRDGRQIAFTGLFESPELWVIPGAVGEATPSGAGR
jgi:Tol biopolymer transport system component